MYLYYYNTFIRGESTKTYAYVAVRIITADTILFREQYECLNRICGIKYTSCDIDISSATVMIMTNTIW